MTYPIRLFLSLFCVVALGCGTSPETEPDGGSGGSGGDAGSGGTDGGGPDGGGPDGGDASVSNGPDTLVPFPLDKGHLPETPGTYKGLPLSLVDNDTPTVTPVDGVIGVVCVGMSNATQECRHYIGALASTYSGQVNPQVKVVDCAVSGNAIEAWNNPVADDRLWDACIDTKLAAGGLQLDQVRVVYHKAANKNTEGATLYPTPGSDYDNFVDNLDVFAGRVVNKFPALQAVYTTARSYGGFAAPDKPHRGEPLSYEEGHALNTWLANNAAVAGVWFGWGPYIWAPDCEDGTNGSGICYDKADYKADGVHPAEGARDKIARMIHTHMLTFSWYAN